MSERPSSGESSSVYEIEFAFRDAAYPFVGVSEEASCAFELAKTIPRADGVYAEYFSVTGADPQRVLSLLSGNELADSTLLTEYDDGGLFELLVSDHCPVARLAELGALPRAVRGVDGEGRIVAEIPSQYDSRAVLDAFLNDFPEMEVASKREKESITPLLGQSAFQKLLRTRLTDRQREVLRTAFECGYYEWPRECTGEDVASELDISSATFSEHIHAAERKLFAELFDEV